MIDLHCHILPGIDDGPETAAGSIALARVAAKAGVQTIVATPHVSGRYQNTSEKIHRLVEEVNERLAAEGIAVQVVPGAEIAAEHVANLDAEEVSRSTLGDGGWVLLEPPFASTAAGFDEIALSLMSAGHRVVIAHPERCPVFYRDIAPLRELVRKGAAASITAGSLAGRFGKPVRKLALRLFEEQLAHNVASDAHDELMRPPRLASDIAAAGLAGLTEWLTELVPAAILAGDDLPPRPLAANARRGRPGLVHWFRHA